MAGSLDTQYNKKINDIKVKKTFTAPLSAIYVEPGFNIRFGEITESSVQELMQAYLAGHPIPPIVIEVQSDDRLKVTAGHRRYTALTALVKAGHTQFERVEVRHMNGSEVDIIRFMVGENGHGRTNLNAVDLAVACKKLADLQHTPGQIAKLLDFSESKVVYHLTIAKMSEQVKTAIVEGKIAADLAVEVFRKSGDDGVMALINGTSTGGKVTRASANLWRPSMGKSVVSLFREVQVQKTDTGVTLTLNSEQWEKIQSAVDALGVE